MFDPRKPLKNEVAQVNAWLNLANKYAKPGQLGDKRDLGIAVRWLCARIEDQKKEILRMRGKTEDISTLRKQLTEVKDKLQKLKTVLESNKKFCDRFHTSERKQNTTQADQSATDPNNDGEQEPNPVSPSYDSPDIRV